MSNLIEITHEGELTEENNSVIVTADFEDYSVKTLVVSEIQLDEAAEPELGIKDSFRQDGVEFFSVEILDEMSLKMNLGAAELVSVKQEIENYLESLVQAL